MKRAAAEVMGGSTRAKINQAKARALADAFVVACQRAGIPVPILEYAFVKPDRAWRFDFAWVDERVALESEGGVWVGGAHTRGAHFLSDMEKYNAAALRGWRVFRAVPDKLLDEPTLTMIRIALGRGVTVGD